MKARTWFHALGQSHEARGLPHAPALVAFGINALPYWAKQAYCAGRLSVRRAGFAALIARMSQRHGDAVTRDIVVTPDGQERWSLVTYRYPAAVPKVRIDARLVS